MEDLAWNPIYMNTQKWRETILCNPFLPSSSSLLQHFLWNFPFQNPVSCLCYSNCCLIVSKFFPPLCFSCIETIILMLLHASQSLGFRPYLFVTVYTSCHIIISGLALLRLKQHMASPHWGHWMCWYVLTSDSGHRCNWALTLNQHWPQVAVWENLIK